MPDKQEPVADLVERLRGDGWAVAVHNDYRLNGENYTFWLLTKGDRFVKGEGKTDAEALSIAWEAASTLASLEAENAGLREALKPFAKFGEFYSTPRVGGFKSIPDEARHSVFVGDLRRARNLLEGRTETEATRLRDGIQKLIDGDFAGQSLERVRDRLKALLEEADG